MQAKLVFCLARKVHFDTFPHRCVKQNTMEEKFQPNVFSVWPVMCMCALMLCPTRAAKAQWRKLAKKSFCK